MSKVLFTATAPSLKMNLSSGQILFDKGVFETEDEGQIAAIRHAIATIPAVSQMVREIDVNKAAKIAEAHAKELRKMSGATQGPVTTAQQAEQIRSASDIIKETEAAHSGIKLDPDVKPGVGEVPAEFEPNTPTPVVTIGKPKVNIKGK